VQQRRALREEALGFGQSLGMVAASSLQIFASTQRTPASWWPRPPPEPDAGAGAGVVRW
jgi:hypothetical protein